LRLAADLVEAIADLHLHRLCVATFEVVEAGADIANHEAATAVAHGADFAQHRCHSGRGLVAAEHRANDVGRERKTRQRGRRDQQADADKTDAG
jgi:hypothetical protein